MADLRPGVYEQLVTDELHRRLATLDPARVERAPLDPGDAHEMLARHVGELARRALRSVPGNDAGVLVAQVELTNRMAEAIAALAPDAAGVGDLVADTRDLLRAITDPADRAPGPVRFPPRPHVPLSTSALLVNGRDQPRIGVEVQRELASADRVDLLCAFVKWYGVRVLDEHIGSFIRRGGRMRVITTTYIGATDRRASTGWRRSVRRSASPMRRG